MSKFTPGPWRTGKGAGSRYTVYDKFSQRVGDFFEGVMATQRSDEECAANARLGAAAPDLLATLVDAHDIIDAIGQPETAEVAARMRAVIAKAKGEA
jgi:hypothetical protein